MPQRILWLHRDGLDPAEVGGKAASLGRLLRAGLPVPPGFCVTIPAFQEALAPIQAAIDLRLAVLSREESVTLSSLAEEVGRQVQTLELPFGLVEELRNAYGQLRRAEGRFAVCVRSSATAEDLPGATFAGMHDSYLNVLAFDPLLEGIRQCWASLWSPRALSYRLARGLESQPYRMAVLVQYLVPAESAGVLFTRDPVTGDRSRLTIQSAWGLGETVVQGSGTADTLVFHRETGTLQSSTATRKERLVATAPEGGLQTLSVPHDHQDLLSLPEETARILVRMALEAENLLGEAQDIEWALADGQIYILQSRPVVLREIQEFPIRWERPQDAKFRWTLNTSTEPQAFSPLEMDLRSVWMEARLAALSEGPGPTGPFDFRFFNGYLYTRLVAEETNAAEGERHQAYFAKVSALSDQGKTLWEEEVLPEIEANLKRLEGRPFLGTSAATLLEYLRYVLRIHRRHWTLHWLMGTLPVRSRWERTYQELTGEPPGERAEALLTGTPNLTRKMLDGLIDLARAAQASPGTLEVLRDCSPADVLGRLTGSPEGVDLLHRLQDFLADFGLRTGHGFGSSSSWRTPTWLEEPSLVLEVVQTYLEIDLDSLEAQERRLLARREEAEETALARIPTEEGRQIFRHELGLARRAAAVMEDHNFYIEQMTDGYLRLCLVEAGQNFVNRGLLSRPGDVFFLTLEEVEALLTQEPIASIAARVEQRQEEWSRWSRLRPPRFVGAPASENLPQEAGPARPSSHTLTGTAASAGVATGRARVIESDQVVPAVERGDILVANNAGPLWIPILPILGGMVLNEGVLFQHAASIAREYGVPTVIETRVATQTIRDGQTVTVDGDKGMVYLEG